MSDRFLKQAPQGYRQWSKEAYQVRRCQSNPHTTVRGTQGGADARVYTAVSLGLGLPPRRARDP